MMASSCWMLKILFLLSISWKLQWRVVVAIPIGMPARSDLIDGNEFLSLFIDRDDFQRQKTSSFNVKLNDDDKLSAADSLKDIADLNGRDVSASLLTDSSETIKNKEKSKQVVKLVTTGSKIVFIEELDALDGIDERDGNPSADTSKKRRTDQRSVDDIKVVAVSVSSTVGHGSPLQSLSVSSPLSSSGGNNERMKSVHNNNFQEEAIYQPDDSLQAQPKSRSHTHPVDFINRSHKNEFSIEEVEPLTMTRGQLGELDDSVNSESNNIQNILVVQPFNATGSSSGGIKLNSSANLTALAQINLSRQRLPYRGSVAAQSSSPNLHNQQDKLGPFQTVIYHDNKQSHGPQSRSISYSSIAQNIDELHSWKGSEILLAAKRNVSESLKGTHKLADEFSGENEPAKFYSVPAKMYSVPAKFYSEPAKVYSEPAKMYGQPEKQYGEPSKVYSEPSRFYSEPAKVYSQPSKMYGEPSKTYWPNPTSSSKSTTPTTTSTTTTTTITTTTTVRPSHDISFDRARNPHKPTHGQVRDRISGYHPNSPANAHSRRILFNLDKLPYDLLNDPEQAAKRLLEPELVRTQTAPAHEYQPARPCQEEKLSLANQRVKGHFGRDLVKCGPDRSLIATTRHNGISTERSNMAEFYAPTPEQNYEIEESVSVMTNGRAHGVQVTAPVTTVRSRGGGGGSGGGGFNIPSKQNNNGHIHANANANRNADNEHNDNDDDDDDESKVGYVVEGRNFRKYRVEEKTPDGFIVGEYGVVSNNDGNLRGVRYTADSNINPSLIHQALMKFLSL